MTPATPPATEIGFRPETFFLGRTEGTGIIRNVLGAIIWRVAVRTEGTPHPTYPAIDMKQVFTFDDGDVQIWRWTIQPTADSRYLIAESQAGPGIVGRRAGSDFLLEFNRPTAWAPPITRPHFSARFTALAEDVALETVRIGLLGAPLARLTTIHRKVGAPKPARAIRLDVERVRPQRQFHGVPHGQTNPT